MEFFFKFGKKTALLPPDLLHNNKIYHHSRNTHSKMGESGFDLNIYLYHPDIEMCLGLWIYKIYEHEPS